MSASLAPARLVDRHGWLARQFGHPRGPVGHLIGRGMARRNGAFNAWVVRSLRERLDPDAVTRVAELGSGPGVALAFLLDAFPAAHVWGVDLSSAMLGQARRRNAGALASGRLELVRGDTATVRGVAPLDLIAAVHVLYFWPDPVEELTLLRGALGPGGALALGYQLAGHMPPVAQQQFPRAGHRLYRTDDDVRQVLAAAGFTQVDIDVKGRADAPHGRLALARPARLG